MSQCDVSVIIPCFNTRNYLGEAIESALAQQPEPLEIVVVDDGSTDDSVAVAESFGARVRVLRKPHRGIGATRNDGLRLARGALLAFLDADDLWPAGSIAERFALLDEDTEADAVHGYVEQFVSPELPVEIHQRLVAPPGLSHGRLLGAVLIRRAAADRIGLFDETLRTGEAIDWIDRSDSLGVRWRRSGSVVLRRRIHGNNTGAREAHARVDYLRVLKQSLDRRRAAKPSGSAPDV